MQNSFESELSQDQLRKRIRATRNALTASQQRTHASQAQKHFIDFFETHLRQDFADSPLKLAVFLSQDGELGTQSVIETLWQTSQFELFLPVLDKNHHKTMRFGRYTPQTKLVDNHFKIPEPQETTEHPFISADQLDLVLTPLVAYDAKGDRIGMGGGFYDQTFHFKTSGKPPLFIGWAHECQKINKIERNPWDIPLDALINESGWQVF